MQTDALKVQAQYSNDSLEALPLQHLLYVKILLPEIEKINLIREITELTVIKIDDMNTSLSEVYPLLLESEDHKTIFEILIPYRNYHC